jgi:hypothetical protein
LWIPIRQLPKSRILVCNMQMKRTSDDRADHFRRSKGLLKAGTVGLGLALLAVLLIVVGQLPQIDLDYQPFSSSHLLIALLFLILAGAAFLRGARKPDWDALSPFRLFYSLWFGAIALCWIQLADVNEPFTLKLWVTLAVGLGGFGLGGWLERLRVQSARRLSLEEMRRAWSLNWDRSRALFGLTALFAICSGALIYEYYTSGFLPLTSDSPEWARAAFAVNPFVHRFSLTFYLLMAFAYMGYTFLKHFKPLYLALSVICYVVVTLLTVRLLLLIGFVMIVTFYNYFKHRLSPKWVILALLLGYPASKFAVDAVRFYSPSARLGYEKVLYKAAFPKRFWLFAPDYLYITGTMVGMQELLETVPDKHPYSHGFFLSYPLRAVFAREGKSGAERISALVGARSRARFGFAFVVTSYLGEPYADFGVPGVLLFSLFFGWLSVWAYERLRRSPTFVNSYLYSQLAFALIISVYASYLVLIDFYWCMALGFILHLVARKNVVTGHGANPVASVT